MASSETHVIATPPRPVLPVRGTDATFPVRRIYCVGRNYAAHAIEMGHDPDREDPFFFQKSADNILTGGADMPYPPRTSDMHHEIELAVALKSGGSNIPVAEAETHIYGYATSLDMTRRDLQADMKAARRPWEIGKAFENSCPIAHLVPAAEVPDMAAGTIWLDVNGTRRQTGDLNQMIWKTPEIISYLSGLFTLAAGDLILTGTPSGVAAAVKGDKLHAHIDGLPDLHTTIV